MLLDSSLVYTYQKKGFKTKKWYATFNPIINYKIREDEKFFKNDVMFGNSNYNFWLLK